ncbi:MAG TPA: tetratricopeptide repeat protein [Planctomycetota bacterium]|nr:tetratricopeptide repeat protein [Planctomycetota bacterium]
MTTAAPSLAGPVRANRSPWFRSATFDLLLILGVPFLTWPLVMLGQDTWGPGRLNQLILLTATGHYFATFVRAYGDRELFARFRARFLVAPAILLATCIGMFTTGHGPALLLVTAAWAFWHWLAQAFGFARIYDSKQGSFRPLTALLDKALVIAGFVGAVMLNDGALAEFGKAFVSAGVPLPAAAQFAFVQQIVLAAMVLVGAAYVANLVWTIWRRRPWSWQKQFMHATTIGYYWFAFAWLPNVLVAYVLYELFHDIQYYAITWITCRQRVRRPGVAPWLVRMFRPGWTAALGFVLVMSAFGAVDAYGRAELAPEQLGHQVWLGVFLTAALLHYYYDGFIWKARESTLGADLGIQGGLRAAMVPGLRHAGHWALFFVPLLATVALGRRDIGPRERVESLVALAPGDFLTQADLGLELTKARELPAALEHYRASVALNPDLAQTRANYGAALDLAGDLDGAREQYEAALRCRDNGGAHAQAHTNLGVVLLVRGDLAAADAHFRAAALLGAQHPIGRMMALAAAMPAGAEMRREQLYAAVLQLDARQFDARIQLADLLLARGQFEPAAGHYATLLRGAPDFVPGLVGLATAQANLGQIEQARATLQRALQREPGDAQALALRARLGF